MPRWARQIVACVMLAVVTLASVAGALPPGCCWSDLVASDASSAPAMVGCDCCPATAAQQTNPLGNAQSPCGDRVCWQRDNTLVTVLPTADIALRLSGEVVAAPLHVTRPYLLGAQPRAPSVRPVSSALPHTSPPLHLLHCTILC